VHPFSKAYFKVANAHIRSSFIFSATLSGASAEASFAWPKGSFMAAIARANKILATSRALF
jgi:hypothetical protein